MNEFVRSVPFSNVYDDMPNCQFFMAIKPWDGKFRVLYFTMYGDNMYDLVTGLFTDVQDLNAAMHEMTKERPQMTARLWLYSEDLWSDQLRRLAEAKANS